MRCMAERRRLGVLLTHPVQYYAPLFRRLAESPRCDLAVYFAHRPSPADQGKGFGVAFEWDTDLLSGYESRFLENRAANPTASTFAGCDTPEISEIIARERFDAFLVMGWHAKSYWQAMRACWATRTPVLARGDSQFGANGPTLRAWLRLLTHRQFIPRFAACLAVGIRSEEYFRFYGARRVVRSPHFIDNDHFSLGAAATDVEAVRRGWGVSPGAMVAAFVGKLMPGKRPMDLINAAAASGRGDIHLVFVGDGVLRAECEAAARQLGVAATFTGFCNQSALPSIYAAIDTLVLPSESETWGLVVNEAMACGKPVVVSTAVGCTPDLVLEGRTGHAFRVGDVRALAGYLDGLAGAPEARAALGTAARQQISAYTADAAAAGVLTAMEQPARGEHA